MERPGRDEGPIVCGVENARFVLTAMAGNSALR